MFMGLWWSCGVWRFYVKNGEVVGIDGRVPIQFLNTQAASKLNLRHATYSL